VTNFGTISGGIAGVDIAGPGIVTNYGAISGVSAVHVGGGDTAGDTVVNAGTIAGTGVAVAIRASGGLLVVEPGAVFVGKVEGRRDTLELAAGYGTLSGLGSSFVGFTTVDVDAGADWAVSGSGSRFVNDGTVAAYGALVFEAASGRGTIEVGDGDTAEFAGAAGHEQRIELTGAGGTVLLDKPLRVAATFSGFGAGDTIDLAGEAADAVSFAHHDLVVTENGQTVADLHFAGRCTTADFALSPDGNGGTDITLVAPTASGLWTMRG
jgi:hypothetical protein